MNAPAPATALDADTVPPSFGVFKPVGHVMVGLPTQAQVEAMAGQAGTLTVEELI